MLRTVSSHIEAEILGPTRLVFAIAAASPASLEAETLDIRLDGSPVEVREVADQHGGRLHALESEPGLLTVDYAAVVRGRADAPRTSDRDLFAYLRPSRYCESDSLTPTARAEFGGLAGLALLEAVKQWVGSRLIYVPGSSLPTDGAARTLIARRGVCRDYAHLVIALLRALDVPARMAAGYAPGLYPMDFHAIAEAWVDGEWYAIDATGLAPRQSFLRTATGRDAADTAWLSSHWTDITLRRLEVMAVADALPVDDGTSLIQVG